MSVKKLPISFKENEQYIRDYITSHLNYSAYVKELVLRDMKKECKEVFKEDRNTNFGGFDF